LAKKSGMGADSYKDDRFMPADVCNPANEQEIAPDMAFAMSLPFAHHGVIPPLGRERPLVGDEHHHRRFEPNEVEPTGVREALPRGKSLV